MDTATAKLGLDRATHELLRWPQKEPVVTIPVPTDDGRVKVSCGYRVQYNSARGPKKGGFGGTPMRPSTPCGAWPPGWPGRPRSWTSRWGGKGGVTCNPKLMSEGEKQRLARDYMRAVAGILSVAKEVPAPDVYTTPQITAWMMDEYETLVGQHHPGVISGKPLALGASEGRGDATARGGIYVTREAAKALGLSLQGKTMAIQGFGNAGQYAALLGHELLGLTLVAASDSKAARRTGSGTSARKYRSVGATVGVE